MTKFIKYPIIIVSILLNLFAFNACEDYLNPEQALNVTEDQLLNDYYEYRSLEMGLYGLQQKLVEQIVILGELRGDLLTVTPNADADMFEVNNFSISENNKYADPTNFFKLIASSNNFIRLLEKNHPEVLDPKQQTTNYDKMFGEALCMRAWAYFMATRIYGKVPVIHESLTTIEEINDYINSSGTYTDSIYIEYSIDGYYNDTVYKKEIYLEKQFYDLEMVLDIFTNQLENEVKGVGVNHYLDNNDQSWEITIWNPYALDALLGLMYLTKGDLSKADFYFRKIVINSTNNFRYQLDNTFSNSNWKNMFSNISNVEHIYVIPFSKKDQQQNQFQEMFEPFGPYKYQLKPSGVAIKNWETVWRGQSINKNDAQPDLTIMNNPGFPGDKFRGPNASYAYFRGSETLPTHLVDSMLYYKSKGDTRSVESIITGYEPMVYKYSINKELYDEDINFSIFRAGSIQLYRAEIYTYYYFPDESGVVKPFLNNAVNIINDGSNYSTSASRVQKGVRGRVGLGNGDDKISVSNIEYLHDPYTNEIIGYFNIGSNFTRKQNILEDKIMDERAREMAFEGERFYDLMRVAYRRNDPSYLASKVSQKYPPGQREQIFEYLMDQNNWYIHVFD